MLDRDPDLRRVLKWAAGCPADVSDIGGVDEDRLLEQVAEHRLARCLLDRLRRDKPAWGRRSLMTRAWGQCQRAGEQMRRHAAALREIAHACAAANQPPPIMVKGFSLYALTGRPEHLRYSADMDLFGDDPTRLVDTLRALGYADVARVSLAPHEYAVMERGGVLIEVHSHFPVQCYPASIIPLDYIPEQHPGIWWQPEYQNSLPHTEITYQDMMNATARGAAPEADGLTMLTPPMMVIILCAHIFRNIIEGRRPRVCEFADVRDLVQHPAFDSGRFSEIVEKFEGRDAVRMTNHIGMCCLGTQLLPQDTNEGEWNTEQRLLQALGYWVGWHSFEEMLLPPEPGDLFARLGANAVIAATGGVSTLYSVMGAGAGEQIMRLIVPTSQECPLPFKFSVAAVEEMLIFDVFLPQTLADEDQGYHVRFDDEESTHLFSANIRSGAADHAGAGSALLRPFEGGYGLCITLPRRTLPRPTVEGAVPLIFSVVLDHFQGKQWVRADPSVRVPLLVKTA